MAKEKFVKAVGQASRIKNFRHLPNGNLMPFFDSLVFPAEEIGRLSYLCEEGTLVRVTIAQTEKNLFETEQEALGELPSETTNEG